MSRITTPRLTRLLRIQTTYLSSRSSSSFSRPSPPKLPASLQAEFEKLQRKAAVSQAFQSTSETEPTESTAKVDINGEADGDVNQGMFRGAKPEFEGETNPKTGEIGGPKNEPLRWGGAGDWSYNGRVTDF